MVHGVIARMVLAVIALRRDKSPSACKKDRISSQYTIVMLESVVVLTLMESVVHTAKEVTM